MGRNTSEMQLQKVTLKIPLNIINVAITKSFLSSQIYLEMMKDA